MGNEHSAAAGTFHIPSADNIVKIVVLGNANNAFKLATDKLCPEEGDYLLPTLGVDVRQGKVELRRQTAHRTHFPCFNCTDSVSVQYWLADLSTPREHVFRLSLHSSSMPFLMVVGNWRRTWSQQRSSCICVPLSKTWRRLEHGMLPKKLNSAAYLYTFSFSSGAKLFRYN